MLTSLDLAFAARTAHLLPGTPTPVIITIQPDRTFTFVTRTPPTSYLIKQAAGIETGAGEAGKAGVSAGSLSVKHVYEIAKLKATDDHLKGTSSLESVARSVMGSCKSMGVTVVP